LFGFGGGLGLVCGLGGGAACGLTIGFFSLTISGVSLIGCSITVFKCKNSPRQSRKTSESSLSNVDESSPKHNADEVVIRRRAKSPKRSTAPSRPAVIPVSGPDNRHSLFTKELEMRLSKNIEKIYDLLCFSVMHFLMNF
jgi:hypothetical protein